MKCDCKDWQENIEILNGPIMLQSVRTGTQGYTGKFFKFCPWCSSKLREENEILHTK